MQETNNISEKLKKGYTTGSVATLAAKASTWMLLSRNRIDECEITLPGGEKFTSKINSSCIDISNLFVSCSVIKPDSDDPDITAGIEIFAKASIVKRVITNNNNSRVLITGGPGIGIVTRKGLEQPVSEYAINSVPRKMISEAVENVMDEFDCEDIIKIEISAPEGIEIAKKTFNPHMGIEGGISIIGTTGIVEPMSSKALVDTILLDIKMHYAENREKCIIVPGNYGVTFLKNTYGINENDIVLCSNYVGDSIKMAVDTGFKNILFCSHIGKLIKVYGGMMNTHSMYGDHRIEFMMDALVETVKRQPNSNYKVGDTVLGNIKECVSTTAVLDYLSSIDVENKLVKEVSKVINDTALKNLYKEAEKSNNYDNDEIKIQCIMYENTYGELANSRY